MSTDSPLQLPPEEPDPALGRVIRLLREERGLSQAALADRSGVEIAILAEVEKGAIDPPWPTVEAIANGLQVSVASIAAAATAEDADAP